MQWTDDLLVGDKTIDDQHKELFRRIGELVDAVKKKECKFLIDDTFKFIEQYVIKHFSDEEKIMLDQGYPGYDEQKAAHDRFIEDLRALKDELKLEESSYTRSVYTNQIVVDWIVAHIKQSDKKLGAFLKAKDQETV